MIKNGLMACYRCSNNVDENYKKYDVVNLIACKECVKLIEHWLSKGFEKKSFTF